ncbi:MAG: hypothetical protein HC868_15550, partial [Sphingomonadales bacterium]|nr:hypothetical protein [Sphingomonadales bacterium]
CTVPASVHGQRVRDDIKACMDAGMDGFVAKPVRKKVLLDAIAQAVSAHAKPVTPPDVDVGDVCASQQQRLAPPASGDALDRAAYHALAQELGEEGMHEAIAAFVAEMAGRLEFLRQHSLEQDRTVLSREAHTIKGTAGTFGFHRLSELAKWLERNADKVTAEEFAGVAKRLEAAFDQAKALLPNLAVGHLQACPNDAARTANECLQKEAS